MWKVSACIAILCAGWSATAEDEGLPQLVEKLSPSVVSLQVVTEDGREFLGSGFFVGANGEIATILGVAVLLRLWLGRLVAATPEAAR